MKKIVSLALLGATTSLMALYAEPAYLYKDPRIMGMGGTNVAVGSYSTSVFSNPAGLAKIKKEHGFVVDLLGIGVSASSKFQDFISDVDDVEEDNTDAMMDVLAKYSGEHFHMGVDNYTSISKNSDAFAWSLGLLAATDFNFMPHTNGGEGFLTTSSRAYGGIVFGAAKPYQTDIGRLDVGFSLKYIMQKSYEGALEASTLVSGNEDLTQKIQDEYEKDASGIGLDLGVTYYPLADSALHPAVGLSILNIGSMGMDDNYGNQPMTVNLGVSITPEVPILDKVVLAADYVDVLNANKLRMYNINSGYSDYDDTDMMKRLRFGASIGLLDTTLLSTTLNGGLYQGSYTAGLNFELLLFKLNVATYEEQLGTGGTEIADRRYMAQLAFGW